MPELNFNVETGKVSFQKQIDTVYINMLDVDQMSAIEDNGKIIYHLKFRDGGSVSITADRDAGKVDLKGTSVQTTYKDSEAPESGVSILIRQQS